MKILCFDCGHDCHCDDKCDALPMDGGCGCLICNHITLKSYEDYMGENMFKKIWKKIVEWLWK